MNPIKPTHRRMPRIIQTPLDEIVVDPAFRHDQRLINLIVQKERGTISVAFTRLRTTEITSGFLVRSKGHIEYATNLDASHVPLLISMIRRGHRPQLLVYRSPFASEDKKYVCADDGVALAAYRELGIQSVPCEILKPFALKAGEASLWFRSVDGAPTLVRSIPSDATQYPSLLGDVEVGFSDLASELGKSCASTRKYLKEFHIEDIAEEAINYHQMLYAILRRQEEIVSSLRLW